MVFWTFTMDKYHIKATVYEFQYHGICQNTIVLPSDPITLITQYFCKGNIYT